MQDVLKVALIQTDLIWENPEKNRESFSKKFQNLSEDVDLTILPEMFTSGFTMNAKAIAETMQGDTVTWMQQMASKHNTAIVGSIVVTEDNKFYNRLLFVTPNGTLQYYDKRHTFTLAGEDKVYSTGIKKLIIDYKGWKICPLICYDLRFPVWSRNTEDYDVLLYVANWPKPRIAAWDALLKARAIENMSYCIGVNRVGIDGLNIEYSGNSAVYDLFGNEISNVEVHKEQIEIITLQKEHITRYREKLKFLDDSDDFTVL